ncbi:TetR/AcrR family transcriptional regulator [Jatrophihabitans cynanchi]|uniref:TetR/AcrR family transcriptional regulator n=1 Tax=Jatrophihabitans cynanchi TaxID=2944128 RepID=A0ABY7K361_9ACTN|nr:TetR/AcrR family transcriptional regulator [Jatrophihabitans sp. SB3-54]WAX57561.1 TetR/AcrR family transcriptional regulator [Jatrophihabitans sp. SB3-54]
MANTAEQLVTAAALDCTAARKPMRADARRNYDRLLAAARAEFASRGAGASLEEIARRAEVGVGTLYRHFPTRQALLEAVYVEEVMALCRSAEDFAAAAPWDALADWLSRFVDYVATKRALAEEMMTTMSKDAPVFRTCHDAIFAAGEPLLARAKAEGVVRDDVEFLEVIQLVSGITMVRNATPDQMKRVLSVALDGLRYGVEAG